MAALPDPGRSRAVLIGASTYRHLEDLPAVSNNLTGLRDVLINPALGGLPADKCAILEEPAGGRDVYRALREQATAAEDTLLVYFSGHGRTGTRNELYLCLPGTEPDLLSFTALAYEQFREAVADGLATKKVVILDCCFSGRALADQAGDEETIIGQVGIEGSYILTATPANAVALAPPGERYTAFTGALLHLLRTGIPGGRELLTFAEIYPKLKHTLISRQLPKPRQQGSDTITDLALTRNPAYRRPAPQLPLRSAATRILTDAIRAAQSIPDEGTKASALADIAKVVAATDPDRAARLIADAERIAQSITAEHPGSHSWPPPVSKAPAPALIAEAVAATDPDRAERIAQSITDERHKPWALARIAKAVAATDSDRAERLATDAERMAQSITDDGYLKASALAQIAGAVAATDSDRAERLATDAERIAQSITDSGYLKASALADIAEAVAAIDPDRAERIAQSITHESQKPSALARIAKTAATTDSDRAERIAQSIPEKGKKASALADIAKIVAATDPDRAERLATDAERIAQSITDDGYSKASALADIAEAVAATDPDRAERLATDAERIAQSLSKKSIRASGLAKSAAKALAHIAEAVALTDSDRAERLVTDAERIAQSIPTDGYSKVWAWYFKASALLEIAETYSHR